VGVNVSVGVVLGVNVGVAVGVGVDVEVGVAVEVRVGVGVAVGVGVGVMVGVEVGVSVGVGVGVRVTVAVGVTVGVAHQTPSVAHTSGPQNSSAPIPRSAYKIRLARMRPTTQRRLAAVIACLTRWRSSAHTPRLKSHSIIVNDSSGRHWFS
jgi:hypothetical protein